MKKKTFKGMLFSLMACPVISICSGCGNIEVKTPSTSQIVDEDSYKNVYYNDISIKPDNYTYKGKDYKEAYDPSAGYINNEYNGITYDDGISTSDLYFIRNLDNIYLATKVVDVNEENIVSKYYAINTGEFLGQTLDINWYARAIKDIDKMLPKGTDIKEYKPLVNDNLNDVNYFNGEYGLGKNLCIEGVINATSIFNEEKLTKEQIDNLLNDSLRLTSLVDQYKYPDFKSYLREDYTFIPYNLSNLVGTYYFSVAFNGETSIYYKDLHRLIIEDSGSEKIIIGYRTSNNKTDVGYNYIYDIATSSYIDISKTKILEERILASTTFSPTIGKFRELENIEEDKFYSIDDINVISTLNLDGDDVFEKYYIAMLDNNSEEEICNYKILGNSESINLTGRKDGSYLSFEKDNYTKTTASGAYNGQMMPLKDCLINNNLLDYVKETYTNEELVTLVEILRNNNLILKNEQSNSNKLYQRINIEDVIVIDTSKESDDNTLVASDKKYIFLIPYEMACDSNYAIPDSKFYETCDQDAMAAISLSHGFVKVDNIVKTFYCVINQNGQLNCIRSLENVLQELGYEELIKEDYALIDLQNLMDQINIKDKVLTFR